MIARVTGELADLAKTAAAEAAAVLRNGRPALPAVLSQRMRGRLRRALDELAETIGRAATIVAHTRSRLGGQFPDSATRRVRLHDGDARDPQGAHRPALEFGYKARVIDNDDGVIMDFASRPAILRTLPSSPPAIIRIGRRSGSTPRSVTADRGYGEPATERELEALGVPHGHYPAQSQGLSWPSRLQHARGFHSLSRWRTGSEGRISYLKRGYGWDPTRLNGREGASIWCGTGIQPQPGQGQRPGQPTRSGRRTACRRPNSALGLFQVEVARSR